MELWRISLYPGQIVSCSSCRPYCDELSQNRISSDNFSGPHFDTILVLNRREISPHRFLSFSRGSGDLVSSLFLSPAGRLFSVSQTLKHDIY